ncbi:putative nicotinate phosphoribosyltransferase [Proteus penneri ATCC 35198]|nr:putative nicotinate phosphoribosyltransferase [Proteus penneri ATCC 35198]
MILDATPIITSLLDTDAYKLHMQQAVYHHYSDIPVVAEFRCRSDERLGEYATTLRHQVNMMADLSLTNEEFDYLQSLPFFKMTICNGLSISALSQNKSRFQPHLTTNLP